MYVSYRQLMALAAAAVAIVTLAVAVRISKTPLVRFEPLNEWLKPQSTPLGPDPSFYANQPQKSPQSPKTPGQAGLPVSAAAYLVGDVSTGTIYLEKNARLILPVASMSKLITAIAATDTFSLKKVIEITPPEYDVASDTSRIAAGEKYTVSELLYPLLLNSSNVAAEALASSTNRAKFLELMSAYAWEIGMPSTYFADPSGINPNNVSTARDFFALAQYLYKSRPDILALTRTIATSTATTTDHGAHDFVSIHPFVTEPFFLGGKTGHTPEAHDTMLTILKLGGKPIAIVVLASDDRKKDTAYLAGQVQTLTTWSKAAH